MATIPLLVLLYVSVTYALPHTQFAWSIIAIVALSMTIAGLGAVVARDMVIPITTLAKNARQLAEGRSLEGDLPINRADELGDLSSSMNRLNQRIRMHMDQLREYGEQVHELNTEIHQRVLAFSNLLHVGNLISQGVPVDEVFSCAIEKLSQIEEADLYALLLPAEGDQFRLHVVHGANPQHVALLKGATLSSDWLARLTREAQQPLVIDARNRPAQEAQELERLFGVTNAVIVPVISRSRSVAFVLVGNRAPDFAFDDEVLETTKIFAKQVAIAMENDSLTKRASALTVTDEMTGLYNERYLRARLDEEIKRAGLFHHPCSLILLDLDGFQQVARAMGTLAAETCLKQAATTILELVGPVDQVARVQDDAFALLLPERTKRDAIELAETLRRRVASALGTNGRNAPAPVTVSGGISENPLDGATAEELWSKAEHALRLAKRQGKNRIIAS